MSHYTEGILGLTTCPYYILSHVQKHMCIIQGWDSMCCRLEWRGHSWIHQVYPAPPGCWLFIPDGHNPGEDGVLGDTGVCLNVYQFLTVVGFGPYVGWGWVIFLRDGNEVVSVL